MSFNGYLLKVGSDVIPNNYIVLDTYECTPDQRQDVNSYRDIDQNLHRNVSANYKSIVSFQVRAGLSETRLRALIDLIQNNFSDTKERKVYLEYFNTDKGGYSHGYFYWVQPKYKIIRAEGDELFYNSMEIKFIEY